MGILLRRLFTSLHAVRQRRLLARGDDLCPLHLNLSSPVLPKCGLEVLRRLFPIKAVSVRPELGPDATAISVHRWIRIDPLIHMDKEPFGAADAQAQRS